MTRPPHREPFALVVVGLEQPAFALAVTASYEDERRLLENLDRRDVGAEAADAVARLVDQLNTRSSAA